MMDKIFTVIALGSNLGDKADNLNRAVGCCGDFLEGVRPSKIYQTAPMYMEAQPNFLNMAISGDYDGTAEKLLQDLKAVEQKLGRQKTIANGPRIIDLDIIFFGENVVKSDGLNIPHPKLAERDFVLAPLMDICADFVHPVFGVSVRELYGAIESNAREEVL